MTPRWRRATLALFALGALAAVAGVFLSPQRALSNLLLVEIYALGLALAGATFLAIHHLTGAGWSSGLRRVPEAMMGALPVLALLAVPLMAARPVLFPAPPAEEAGGENARVVQDKQVAGG